MSLLLLFRPRRSSTATPIYEPYRNRRFGRYSLHNQRR